MPVPFSGGCCCGAIRYTCAAEPFVSYACHCTACRKRTSAAFGISLQVPSDGLTIDRGTPKTRVRIADSGNERIQHFCGDCGSSLFGAGAPRTDITVVYAGTLDDPAWVPIMANCWTDSALPWVSLDRDIERFAKGPDFAKYFAAPQS